MPGRYTAIRLPEKHTATRLPERLTAARLPERLTARRITVSLYADDPQAHAEYAITDRDGEAVDFVPTVTTGATPLTAAWVGGPGIQRTLRIELADLTAGSYRLRLGNPDGNDVELGSVTLY